MQPLELQKVILPFRKKPTKFLLVPQMTRAWEDIEGILCLLKVFSFFARPQGAKKKTDPPILRFSDYIFALIASTY